MTKPRFFYFYPVVILLLSGCSRPSDTYSPVPVSVCSLQRAQGFAGELEKSLNAGDGSFLGKSFEVDAMLDIAFADTAIFKDPQLAFRTELKKSLKPGARSAALVKAGGNFKFIRAYADPAGNSHIIFRVSSDSTVEDFHDYRLAVLKNKDSTVVIVDYLSFRTNQWLSQNYGDIVVALQMAAGKGNEAEESFASSLAQIENISTLAAESRFKEILTEYDKLNPQAKGLKMMLLSRLFAAMFVSRDAFEEAVKEFAAKYPKDKAIGFNLMSFFLQEQAYDDLLKILEGLEKDLGGEDAYVASAKANVYFKQGKLEEAKLAAERARKMEPDYEAAHWLLLNVHVKTGDFAEAAEDLRILKYEFEVDPAVLLQAEEFAAFAASKEYKELSKEFSNK